MEKKRYKTAGREALIAFLAQNPNRQFTVEELCAEINGAPEQGKSSVYRQLGELCGDGTVRKFQSEENRGSVYQYVGESCGCQEHFHQKCLRCGRIFHLDCAGAEDFALHLLRVHHFEVDRGQSVIYGVCSDCRIAERGTSR